GGAAAHAGHPDDLAPGLHERNLITVPARHLRIDEKGLEATLTAAERPKSVTVAPRPDHEPRWQAGGIERDAIARLRHRIVGGRNDGRLEGAVDFRQVHATRQSKLARRQCGRARASDPHAIAADLDAHTAQPEGAARRRLGENTAQAAM